MSKLRYAGTTQNRSSAPTPELMAQINQRIYIACDTVVARVKSSVDFQNLSPLKQVEAISLLASATAAEIVNDAQTIVAAASVDENNRITKI